jgi:hypothetical protein
MTKDAPAFDFFPERFWFAVEGWPETEICRYFRLLSQAWMRDGLPADAKDLAALARGKVSARILDKFPVSDDGKRRNVFLEEIRAAQRERIAKRREGAQKTNAKRWGGRVAERHPSESLNDSPTSRHHPPPTLHPNTDTSPGSSGETPRDLPMDDRTPPLDRIKAWAIQVMAPKECAEAFWNDHEARGMSPRGYWKDRDGNEILNPHAAFRAFATRWKGNDFKKLHATHRPTPPRSDTLNKPGRYA